jgi:hypothetical protein
VFNADDISDGAAMDYAETFFNHFHEVHATADGQTRPVIVFRRLGTPLALNDVLWERYAIGEDVKVTDSATRAPAKRNVFRNKLETLQRRGMLSLVCNIALGNWSARAAERTHRRADDVRAERGLCLHDRHVRSSGSGARGRVGDLEPDGYAVRLTSPDATPALDRFSRLAPLVGMSPRRPPLS